ncbi:hypothetical protein M8J77_006278 [Diaphorina citri]|nr:hypothetical protein M8J77_006278 [Diaphorina citri]
MHNPAKPRERAARPHAQPREAPGSAQRDRKQGSAKRDPKHNPAKPPGARSATVYATPRSEHAKPPGGGGGRSPPPEHEVRVLRILRTIVNRKRSWLGHTPRRDCLQRRIMEGELRGKRSIGRKMFGMLRDVLNGRTFEQMKEDARDREKWRTSC